MALFAGDEPIMTGEELTYDYNFDPFSNKNVQKCLCGSENCRGVLGPKSKEAKPPKKSVVKGTVKAGKRKLKDFLAGDEADSSPKSAKKRKLIKKAGPAAGRSPSAGKKRSLSSSGLKAAKGAATALKRSVSTMSLGAKAAMGSKTGGTPRRASTGGRIKVASTSGKKGVRQIIRTTKAAIAASTAARSPAGGKGRTIVAASGRSSLNVSGLKAGDGNKRTPKKKAASPAGKATTTSTKKRGKAVSTPSSLASSKKSRKNTPTTVTVKTPSLTSPRKRVPSRKVLEAEAVQSDLLLPEELGLGKKSPGRSPRKGLELSRAAKVRLVEDSE